MFPANSHPKDKASYDFTITVPEGHRRGQRNPPRTVERPRPYDIPLAAVRADGGLPRHGDGRKFKVEQYTTRDGLKVYNAVDPRELPPLRAVLKKLPSVLAWESGVFGPYPFRAAGAIVDRAPQVGYALETQTCPVYDSAPDLSTLVHESAHQWFGDSVSLTAWQDIWLNEGFATYAEWLYAEQHGGKTAQQTFDSLYASSCRQRSVGVSAGGTPGVGRAHLRHARVRAGCDGSAEAAYGCGDGGVFRILRTWATEHRGGHGTTAQFIRLSERLSGKDLGALFHTWIGTAGKPTSP